VDHANTYRHVVDDLAFPGALSSTMLLPNNTLQSSLEEGTGSSTSSNAYNAKGGCADIIRTMLREQKKECAALHAHPLFREFRNDKKHARDRAVEQGPPVIDDLEAGRCCSALLDTC
jgi:hypothetical protein